MSPGRPGMSRRVPGGVVRRTAEHDVLAPLGNSDRQSAVPRWEYGAHTFGPPGLGEDMIRKAPSLCGRKPLDCSHQERKQTHPCGHETVSAADVGFRRFHGQFPFLDDIDAYETGTMAGVDSTEILPPEEAPLPEQCRHFRGRPHGNHWTMVPMNVGYPSYTTT
jgi:hypothetical protein